MTWLYNALAVQHASKPHSLHRRWLQKTSKRNDRLSDGLASETVGYTAPKAWQKSTKHQKHDKRLNTVALHPSTTHQGHVRTLHNIDGMTGVNTAKSMWQEPTAFQQQDSRLHRITRFTGASLNQQHFRCLYSNNKWLGSHNNIGMSLQRFYSLTGLFITSIA